MKCGKAVKLVSDYVDGCLAVAVRAEFEAHVSQCERCAAELRDTERLVSSLASLSKGRAPVDCWAGISERITERERRAFSWGGRLLKPAFAVPAVALAIVLALLAVQPSHIEEEPVRVAVPVAEYDHYISAHSRLQREQAFSDPDVTFVAAELQKASLTAGSAR